MNANTATAEPAATAIAEPTAIGGRRLVRAVVWLPGLAVALGAAVVTAHGLYEVALAARVPPGIAWLYPLITDGLALVAYAATVRLRGPAARYAWSVVVLAAGLSGLAQAALLGSETKMDAPTVLRYGVGAWPAVAAAIVAHLLYLLATHTAAAVTSRAGVQSVGIVRIGWCTAGRDRCSVSSCSASSGRACSTCRPDWCPASPPASSAHDNVRRSIGEKVGPVPGAGPGTDSRCGICPPPRPPAHRLRTGRSR
jgi:hypothetical protein